MNVIWVEKENLMAAAMRAMKSVEVMLDIGCGIMPQNYIKPLVHICCEPCGEYVDHLQQKIAAMDPWSRCRYVVLKMGWHDAVTYFPAKSVDTVFLGDVIEHLEKEESRKLLAATENIARKQVILFTPLGFMQQHHEDGKDAWGLHGAEWQEHKSGWLPEDFSGGLWQVFAAREYHFRPGKKPFGAMWAIKTYPEIDPNWVLTERLDMLKNMEIDLREKQADLARKAAEINSSFSVRLMRKIARMFLGSK